MGYQSFFGGSHFCIDEVKAFSKKRHREKILKLGENIGARFKDGAPIDDPEIIQLIFDADMDLRKLHEISAVYKVDISEWMRRIEDASKKLKILDTFKL